MIMIDQAPWILYPSICLGAALAFYLPREDSNEEKSYLFYVSWEFLAVLGITALAFGLRFKGITFGLPDNFHPDEIPKLNAIERMRGMGDLNPRYFLHPSLLLYLTHFTERIGEWIGVWSDTRESLNLAGRTVSLVAGTLTVPVLWNLTRNATKDRGTALLSAALLAVFPLHVTCSRYLKEDALVTFWMTVTAALVMSSVTNPNGRWRLVLAGFFAGIAASSKYTGLIFFVFVAAAPFITTVNNSSRYFKPDRDFLLPAVLAVGVSFIGFILCSPYALLDWPTFINDFLYEQRHMSKGHMVTISPWTHLWSYQFGRSLIPGIGLVNAALVAVALGASVVWLCRERSRTAAICILGLAITYLPAEMVKAKPEPQPDRYLMVCLPWCALLLAYLVKRILASNKRHMLAIVISSCLIIIPLTRTVKLLRDISPDTRSIMAKWINENIPEGSNIAVDYQWYGPVLDSSKYAVTSLHGSEILEDIRIGELRRAGFDYVVISSFFKDRFFRQKDNLGAFRDLFRKIDRELPLVYSVSSSTGPYGFHNPNLTLYRVAK